MITHMCHDHTYVLLVGMPAISMALTCKRGPSLMTMRPSVPLRARCQQAQQQQQQQQQQHSSTLLLSPAPPTSQARAMQMQTQQLLQH
jgi:hypothetical protein